MKLKKLIYGMICICVIFAVSGCRQNTPGTESTPTPTQTLKMTEAPTPGGDTTIVPPKTTEVTIYSLHPSTLEKMAISVLMTEVTPETIVQEVVAAMRDGAFFIGINDVIPKGDTVIVDFKADAPPVIDVGSSVEGTILDAIGQSIIDNLPAYSKVIFRIEGDAYVTGHFELGIDEVYIRR